MKFKIRAELKYKVERGKSRSDYQEGTKFIDIISLEEYTIVREDQNNPLSIYAQARNYDDKNSKKFINNIDNDLLVYTREDVSQYHYIRHNGKWAIILKNKE